MGTFVVYYKKENPDSSQPGNSSVQVLVKIGNSAVNL